MSCNTFTIQLLFFLRQNTPCNSTIFFFILLSFNFGSFDPDYGLVARLVGVMLENLLICENRHKLRSPWSELINQLLVCITYQEIKYSIFMY